MGEKTDRRCFLGKTLLGVAAAGAAYTSIEENILKAATPDADAQPTTQEKPKVDIPPGSLPQGKIGRVSVSRLMIGGNLIGGWAHSRDLMYASKLFKSYNTEAKVFETLELSQACGINTIQIDPRDWSVVLKYNKQHSKIQTLVCVSLHPDKTKMGDEIKLRIDQGADMLYSHGGETDAFMMNGGRIEVIGQMLDLIRAQGVPAGVGGHSLNMPIACEKNKLPVDFYVKTFHTDRYWSATPKERRKEYDWMASQSEDHDANNDGMWCINPEETAAFMETVDKPWVAFKVMAAGAITPRVAFPHAYRHGADFIIAGMFDFQVEPDVKLAVESIRNTQSRKRAWHG
jgi:hypothetical protein